MTTTLTRIPGRVTQLAHNAGNDCGRAMRALSGTATPVGLEMAEAARKRAMEALRELGPYIRQARSELRNQNA